MSDTLSLRLRLVRLDGSLLRADVRFDAVRDREGDVAEHHVTIRDASDRRRSDELRAQWEVLFRVTRRGIAVTDPRTKVLVAVNPAYAAMHGGAVEDFVGLPAACVIAPESAQRLDSLGDEIDDLGFLSYESEHLRTDGSTFPAAVEIMAARDEDGRQLYWLAWVEDLTERRRAERDAAQHAEAMARSNADLDRFAGVVSHDLQSPLRVIAGCARILERRAGDQLEPEQRELRRAHRRRRAPDDGAARRHPRVLARARRRRRAGRGRLPQRRRRRARLARRRPRRRRRARPRRPAAAAARASASSSRSCSRT